MFHGRGGHSPGVTLVLPSGEAAIMSNHYSAANLRFPGDDARLDFITADFPYLGPPNRYPAD